MEATTDILHVTTHQADDDARNGAIPINVYLSKTGLLLPMRDAILSAGGADPAHVNT